MEIKVLSVVTSKYAPFYQDQCESLENKGVKINHISPSKQSPEQGMGGKGTSSRGVFDYAKAYTKILQNQSKDYDLVHVNNGLISALGLLQTTRPIVLTAWGSEFRDSSLKKINQLSSRLYDEVIVPSPSMIPEVPGDVSVVPFGIDTDLFKPIPQEEAREEIGWESNDNIVLFPYPPERGVKNFELASAVVESLSTETTLKTLSGVPHDRVPLYMNASDAVLVTSKAESGPMTVKEAACCNVPVVSTDVGFTNSVLRNVNHSYVCESKSQLSQRLEEVLDVGCRSDGRKFAEEWSLDRMGNELLNVYRKSLNE
ncbi:MULTISPECIES: glycosyltransferase [Haloferax]|uniref:glycosyltransferase n=1 Tax=Haloferax TaxID=2251 RepID=UPI000E229AF3|nr:MULTISPECIES: glycosyltransferase [Haloferax]RDZ38992.1 glycosyl transferase family 1 [Haloferax sp. Atlit-47N]WEL30228.1 Glycosyltransferase [Haloferax alexandrinus]